MYERFELLLKQKGVLTVDVCRATGISQQTISTWKKRRGGISAKNAAKIADYFGVTVAYLMGESDEPTPTADYYIYRETAEAAQELFERPGLRVLFDAARTVSDDQLYAVADMINKFKETNPDG